MSKPSFESLSTHYPTERINGGCTNYENQCAIRLSYALSGAGTPIDSYTDPTCTVGDQKFARGAESLANFLYKRFGIPEKHLSAVARERIAKRTGIVFFKDIAGFRGGIGDHIDLWDGSATKTGEYFTSSSQVWFWELP